MGTSVPDDFGGMSCRVCKAAMKKVSGLPAISDGDIGINLAGMRNEGMTVQRLCLSFLMKSGLNPPWSVNKKAILPEKGGE